MDSVTHTMYCFTAIIAESMYCDIIFYCLRKFHDSRVSQGTWEYPALILEGKKTQSEPIREWMSDILCHYFNSLISLKCQTCQDFFV